MSANAKMKSIFFLRVSFHTQGRDRAAPATRLVWRSAASFLFSTSAAFYEAFLTTAGYAKYSELITGQRGRGKNSRRHTVFLTLTTQPCLTAFIKWPWITSLFTHLCIIWLIDLWIYQFIFTVTAWKELVRKGLQPFILSLNRYVCHCCSVSAPPCTCGSCSCTQTVTVLCSFRFMQPKVTNVFLSHHICTPSSSRSVADEQPGYWSCCADVTDLWLMYIWKFILKKTGWIRLLSVCFTLTSFLTQPVNLWVSWLLFLHQGDHPS